ncbi:MAG: protein adenylyltransferase SelO family protein, partial [Planctomycetota bacterium]|nr:protein adenylyltransferase SelO family protein [Planctomycetota bacterium]
HWNLTRLASAVVPLVGNVEALQEAVDGFQAIYTEAWTGMLASKLGLPEFDEGRDGPLAVELFRILELQETDMTIFFRELAGPLGGDAVSALARASYGDGFDGGTVTALEAWLGSYRSRLEALGVEDGPRRARMDGSNPRYVLRNYLAQLAIDRAAKGDPAGVTELLEVLRRPYEDQPGRDEFAARRPEWARHRAGCSMLSCSS